MNFGEKLKLLRKELGKSQGQVSRELIDMFPETSISQTYLSTLELRKTAPRETILRVFAAYYGVSMSGFLSDQKMQAGIGIYWAKNLRLLKSLQTYSRPIIAEIEKNMEEFTPK